MPPKPRATTNEATPSQRARASVVHTIAPDADATHSASESAIAPGPRPRGARYRELIQTRDKNRYDMLGEHGRGGLGRVSRAHDRDLARTVAIKELLARTDIAEIRFLREALITARLEHPGIVPVYEAGRWPDGTPFYAMKLVAGRSLRDLLAELTTVDERQRLLHHVIAVADAIAYAHQRDIIHRDLKPANVIIGDFGETVVIDWGLAKDLSSATELDPSGSGERDRSDDLTSAGSVLGTPAYMAPEQELGGYVDQRADVFAIGAMLWELCSLQRVPPMDLRHRHRLLRDAGIERDLIVIIDKALAPDPADRYPDAGALATDLKAFKAGGHIASRRYSLPALLVHWARRHRALTLAVSAALAVVAAVSIFYVRNLADERDRTHQALTREADTRQQLEHERDELTLRSAQLLLASDPTAALDQLATYHGSDQTRARQLEAEARGRGVASLRASPHSGNILWARGFADGSIVSLGADGTIVRTTRAGATTRLANNVSQLGASAYSPELGVLAYVCDPGELCLLDLRAFKPIALPSELRGAGITGLDVGPGGQLAVISRTGELRILALGAGRPVERLHRSGTGGAHVKFLDERHVGIDLPTGMAVVAIDGERRTFTDPDGVGWDTSPTEHLVAITTTRGEAYLVQPDSLKTTDRIKLCHQLAASIKIIPGTRTIAFACQEGTIGIWDLATHSTRSLTQVEGRANKVVVSDAGNLVFATHDGGSVAMYDLGSGIGSLLRGHAYRVTVVAPPSKEFPYAISGDGHGALRVWRTPDARGTQIGSAGTRVFATASTTDRILASTLAPALVAFDPVKRELRRIPHSAGHADLAWAGDDRRFATFGDDGEVELWSTASLAIERVLSTDHDAITGVVFSHGDELITSGRDGRIIRHTGKAHELVASFGQPVESLTDLADELVAVTADGQAWRIAQEGSPRRLSPAGAKVTALRTTPDHRLLLGLATGEVLTSDDAGELAVLLETGAAIREIAVSSDGVRIAVAANDETVRIATRTASGWSWTTLSARGRSLSFSSQGALIVGCANGVAWVHARDGAWRYHALSTSDLTRIVPRSDGSAIIIDSYGLIYSLTL